MYLALPAQGKGQQIRGYTVFKPLPSTFVVYELVAPDEYFETARSQYELATATTVFSDPAAAVAARAKMIAAGQDFLNTLTEERLASLADGEEKMYRLYAPSPAGSAKDGTEVGYRTIKVWKGRRSEVSSDSLGNGRDNPEGLLVRTQGRILDRLGASGAGGKGMRIIDTETTAFLSFDRKEEAWITKTAIRDEKNPSGKPSVASEMGARNGRSMNIVQRLPGKADTVIQPLLQGTNYISQAEVQLLGTLLATSKTEGEFGFYAYRPEITTISLRRDMVKRDPANAGALTITTRVRDNKPGPTSIYREDGSLVRTELPPPDGTIWEPSDAETLIRLWRSKGLPVGSN